MSLPTEAGERTRRGDTSQLGYPVVELSSSMKTLVDKALADRGAAAKEVAARVLQDYSVLTSRAAAFEILALVHKNSGVPLSCGLETVQLFLDDPSDPAALGYLVAEQLARPRVGFLITPDELVLTRHQLRSVCEKQHPSQESDGAARVSWLLLEVMASWIDAALEVAQGDELLSIGNRLHGRFVDWSSRFPITPYWDHLSHEDACAALLELGDCFLSHRTARAGFVLRLLRERPDLWQTARDLTAVALE